MGNSSLTSRAVFLDRDGVLNEAVIQGGRPFPPASVAELQIVAGAQGDLQALKDEGFALFVVTNQPDVARGTQTRAIVEAIHDELRRRLPVDEFYSCFHDDGACDCRKPLPGLLLRAAADHNIDLRRSYLIGDRWRDVAAGQAAGVRTVFIDYAYREKRPDPPADATVTSLEGAVAWVQKDSRNAARESESIFPEA